MTEKARELINRRQLTECHPAFQVKVWAILSDLSSHGWLPYVADAWRSPAEQERKYRERTSKVLYSFHNATSHDGNPESLAVDVVDAQWGWRSPKKFWLMLAASAEAHGCASGLYFGLDVADRQTLRRVLQSRQFDDESEWGWDKAHVQFYPNSKLAAVRKGLRP